jgi:hypothetical protein
MAKQKSHTGLIIGLSIGAGVFFIGLFFALTALAYFNQSNRPPYLEEYFKASDVSQITCDLKAPTSTCTFQFSVTNKGSIVYGLSQGGYTGPDTANSSTNQVRLILDDGTELYPRVSPVTGDSYTVQPKQKRTFTARVDVPNERTIETVRILTDSFDV